MSWNSRVINLLAKASSPEPNVYEHAMILGMTNFQAVAASLSVEGEVCDLPNAKLWMQAKTDAEMAPLIQKLAATAIAEIERLILELQEAKDHLQSEKERVEREVTSYTTLTQMTSTTAKIISDAVSQWHPACSESNTSVRFAGDM